MAGAEVEPKPIEPFLTISAREETEGYMAKCPEFGIAVHGVSNSEGAATILYAMVKDHSEVLLARAQAGTLVDGKPVDPTKADLARRVVGTPREQLAEIFRQT